MAARVKPDDFERLAKPIVDAIGQLGVNLHSEMAQVRDKLDEVVDEVRDLKGEVSDLKGEVTDLKSEMR